VGPKDTSKKFSFRVFLFVLLSIIIAGIVAVAAKVNFNITADGGGMLLSVCCFLMWAIIGIVYLIKQLAKSHANES
jgi:ABC-type polysaccharide/polyol phosphate export permease